jgi:hypothetical protein
MPGELTPLNNNQPQPMGLFGPSAVQREIRKEVELAHGRANLAYAMEEARGILANHALEIVGSLSSMEAQLLQVAPLGEARYKLIVDSYAMGAANAINRLR